MIQLLTEQWNTNYIIEWNIVALETTTISEREILCFTNHQKLLD